MAENVGGIYYEVSADTSKLIGQQRDVERATDQMAASFNKITSAIKLYAAAMALVKAAQMADDMRLLAARVQVAAGSIDAASVAMAELQRMSQRTQTELTANAAVFARLNQSILQMGGTQNDTLRITELLGKAIKVSGASSVEASSAMLQFGQALGSGKLAGDELRSLMENAPYLMRQLADGLGVPIGALKKMGEEGKLTADAVVNALGKAAGKIEADFQKMPQTVSGAFALVADAGKRLNLALDEASGKSAILAGAGQGLAEVMNKLAEQFNAANENAGALGRNEEVKTWATKTREALSYVLDAADMVVQTITVLGRNTAFVFESIGAEIGGIGAQVSAVIRGDFSGARAIGQAMETDAAERRRKLDDADKKTLADRKLWGQAMRESWEQGAGGGRGFVNPEGPSSKLKGSGTGDDGKAKFDAAAYIGKLRSAAAEGVAAVNLIEEEALRKNAELLKAGSINAKQAAEAKTLIEQDAALKRMDIQMRAGEEVRAYIERRGKEDADAAKRAEDERTRGRGMAQGVIGSADPVAALQFELEAKSAMLAEYAAKDQENELLYAEARVALEQETQRKIKEIVDKRQQESLAAQSAMLQNYGSLFGNLADITKTFAGEQSGAYKAMFAVSKAFAIADSIVKIQQGVANAMSLPYPANIAAAASTAASAMGIINTIKGTNFGGGRQYGGPAMGGTLYRVNETGAPEMFTAANGSQFMLPTADGRVTAAGAGGGGTVLQVQVVNNMPGAQVSARTSDDGRTAQIVISQLVDQIDSNNGPVMSALKRSTNVRSTL